MVSNKKEIDGSIKMTMAGIKSYLSRELSSDGVGGILDSCTVSNVGTELFDDRNTGVFDNDDNDVVCSDGVLVLVASERPAGEA
jgi:hypothetical protein